MPLKETRRHITFVPVGGLANRMKGVNSAMTLARKSNATLEIIWFTGWELNCPFHQLFAHIDGNGVTLNQLRNWKKESGRMSTASTRIPSEYTSEGRTMP